MQTTKCRFYNKFGGCFKGPQHCHHIHAGSHGRQRVFLGTLLDDISVNETDGAIVRVQETVTNEIKSYYVARGPWHSARAGNGDLVLFQASDEESSFHVPCGRVAARFGTSGIYPLTPIQSSLTEVFTIDEDITTRHEDAFSIECCDNSEHKNCRRIGIHVTAAALGNLSPIADDKIPWYASKWQYAWHDSKWRKEQFNRFSLEEGKLILALSVYVHSKNKNDSEGPFFTVTKVTKNYAHENFKVYNHKHHNFETYEEKLNLLWSTFVMDSSADTLGNESMLQDRSRYPKLWKTRSIVKEMMKMFQSIVQKNVQSPYFVMGVRVQRPTPTEMSSVIVSQEIYENARSSTEISNILGILAACAQLTRDEYREEDYLQTKYLKDVVETPSENYLLCTSPLRDFVHYVNQQIVIHHMISGQQLYEKDELLGIIGIRFHTPKLVCATVKKLWSDWFKLDYIDTTIGDGGLAKVPFTTFNHFEPVMTDKVKIKLKNCVTTQYCNHDIVRLDGQAYRNFREKFAECKADSGKPFAGVSFEEIDRSKSEESLPYRADGNDTVMTLETGVTLHLQISENEEKDTREKTGLRLRLLRIGTNCHLCLTHIHNPELAFMSDRKDVRELIDYEGIDAVRKVHASRREACDTIGPKFCQVEWKGAKGGGNNEMYYSGGIFTIDAKVVCGDLLCIRTDVVEKNSISVEYVWCCHAVVSEVNNAEVSFSVCTLSQTDKPPVDRKFCVEIIRFKNNNTKNPAKTNQDVADVSESLQTLSLKQ